MKKNVAIPIDVLKSGVAEEIAKAGLQDMTLDDIESINETQNQQAIAEAVNGYKVARAAAYPAIGDQLDAILKGFNQFRLDGINLPSELDSVINSWLKVKNDIPKPDGA